MSVLELLVVLHLSSAVALGAILVLALGNRSERAAPWYAGVCVALLLWTLGYTAELVAKELDTKLAWADLEYIGATAFPLLWYIASRVAVGKALPPRRVVWALAGFALLIVACVYLNPGDLFRGQPTLDTSGPVAFVDADYGPLYYVTWIPFSIGLMLASLYVLGRAVWERPRRSRSLRARAALLLAATVLPVAGALLFAAGVLPWPNFNPAMALVSVAAVITACALVFGRLFDVAPLARGAVIEQLADGVVICDARGRVKNCNPAALNLLPELQTVRGRQLSEVLIERAQLLQALAIAREFGRGMAPENGDHDRHDPHDHRRPTATTHEDGIAGVRLWTGAEGQSHYCHVSIVATPVYSSSGRRRGEVIVLRDVTAGVEMMKRLRELATTDELTGLLTRARLFELGGREIDRALRANTKLTVWILDIDHFKSINDTYGHRAGDEVLRAVAVICRGELRSFDLLGRFGGDELVAVLPEIGRDEAVQVAERMRQTVAGLRISHGNDCMRVTVSIGIACGGAGRESLAGLIEAADAALYEAKAVGRDQVALSATCGVP